MLIHRPITLVCAFLCALILCSPAHAATARSADAFVDSIGVNTHLHYQGTVYDTKFGSIISPRLQALGIRHVRDGAYTYAGASASTFFYARCRALAAAGIRFDLITSIKTTWGEATDFAKLASVPAWCGGGVEAFEGPNEPDIQPLPSGSLTWDALTIAAQQALWGTVAGDAALAGIDVIGPSAVWTPQKLGNLSAYLDAGNWHPYPGGQCPTCGDVYGTSIDTLIAKYRGPSGSKPLVVTETGYHNAINNTTSSHRPVTELAAGKYLPRLLLEYFNRGIARTYLYELIDLYPDAGKATVDRNFGLLRNDGTPKPAYTAIQSTIDLLADPGPSFTPGALDFTLSGATTRVHSTLLQKRDGTFFLGLWQERASYDSGARANAADDLTARRDLTVPPQAARVALGTAMGSAVVHRLEPDGTMASSTTMVENGTIDVPVTDSVTFLELVPAPPALAPSTVPDAARTTTPAVTPATAPATAGTAGRVVAAPAAARPDVAEARAVRSGRGVVIRYRLSARSRVTLTVQRRAGRGFRTVRTVRASAAAGRRSLPVPRGLAPGRYRARLVANDGRGTRSAPLTVSFRLTRR